MKKHLKTNQSFEGLVKKFVGPKNFAKLAPAEKRTIREISEIQQELSKHAVPTEEDEKLFL